VSAGNTQVARRRFGAADVAICSAGRIFEAHPRFRADRAWRTTATIDDRGRVIHGLNTAIVKLGANIVVIDPAFFQDEDEASGFFDADMAQTAEQALSTLGLSADDVTHVIVTHGHRDHYWSVLDTRDDLPCARFGQAEHAVPAADWLLPYPGALLGTAVGDGFDGMTEGAFVTRLHTYFEPIRRDGLLRLIDGNCELVPGITLHHTGGETEGHCVVRIDGGGSSCWYLGDLVHFTAEVSDPDIGPTRLGSQQLAQLSASRKQVFATIASDPDAEVVYTHAAFPGWGSIRRADVGGWRWEAR
jgi:glyoxylase-like metal-dependent hydrolase (beta-lactamase superfamily II)